MYELEAVIGEPDVLRPAGSCAPLRHGLALIPVTQQWLAGLAGGSHTFRRPAPGVRSLLAECSKVGPVVHVEAWFFGSQGGQSARIWRDGMVVWERDALELTGPADTWPINAALAELGVPARGHLDLFDEVGLGRYRHTDQWLQRP